MIEIEYINDDEILLLTETNNNLNIYNQLFVRLKYEYNSHLIKKEKIGSTKTFSTKSNEWQRNKCPGCYNQFGWGCPRSPIRCAVCTKLSNSCCAECTLKKEDEIEVVEEYVQEDTSK